MSTPKKIDFIGAQLGWGAKYHETEQGPMAIQSSGIVQALQGAGVTCQWRSMLRPSVSHNAKVSLDFDEKLSQIQELNQRLANEVRQSILASHFPVVLGGDHAIAIGTWSGVVEALDAKEGFGLIWLDAHLDAHTPDTSPSMAVHGMPVALLLGLGDPSLVSLLSDKPKLSPQHIVYIGVRSFEREEQELIAQLGIKVYDMASIARDSLQGVVASALSYLKSKVSCFGISIDLDAFDPNDAPGVGSPVKGGIKAAEALKAFHGICLDQSCYGLEIAEYNPTLDINAKTNKLITDLTVSLFGQKVKK